MINPKEVIDKYHFHCQKYSYLGRVRILSFDREKVVLKEKKRRKDMIFDYLDSKDFPYVLKPKNVDFDDNYEVYPYLYEKVVKKDEKATDMVYLLSLLHNKTSFYKEIDMDDMKAIYEEVKSKVEYLNYYYHSLQDMIEKKVYMAPDEYLLIRNISFVYMALAYVQETIDYFFETIKTKKSVRYALIHGKVETSHFLQSDTNYFISWDHARKDFPLYDFLYFFKKEYDDLDMNSLFDLYQHKYPFSKEEKLLFFALLALPDKLEMKKFSYNQFSRVQQFVRYLEKSREFILKQDKTRQEDHSQKENK